MKLDSGEDYQFDHWFDALTMVHRFKIVPSESEPNRPRIWYNSRRTVDDLIDRIRKTGNLDDFTFGNKRDPCESFWKKAMTVFKPRKADTSSPSGVNVGVTFTGNMPGLKPLIDTASHSSKLNTLITKTDTSTYQQLDPDTLEPLGVVNMSTLHPDLKGPMAAAHAKTCPITGDVFNFNLDFGKSGTYRIFRASPKTGKVDILATIKAPSAYLHSLFLTPSYVVLCVWNSRFTMAGISMLMNRNVLESLIMDKSSPAQWFVVDRSAAQRGVLATYTSDPFFCFHTVNAYEEPNPKNPDEVDIVADMAAYEDMSVLHGLYLNELIPDRSYKDSYHARHPSACSYLARYRLSSVPSTDKNGKIMNRNGTRIATLVSKALPAISPELPTINPRYSTLPHRYVYGIRSHKNSAFLDGLLKHDTETSTAIVWSVRGHTPGEAIFIADPNGTAEDDGVLLCVVLDGFKERSYLLCLDAHDFTELGRAEVPMMIGHGLHQLHLPEDPKCIYNGGD